MRITSIDLQCEDIIWFAIDKNGYVLEFTSGGIGNVPEFICADRETNELLVDFFMNTLEATTSENLIVDYEDNDLMNDAIILSRKGIYCFDARRDSYDKICFPTIPLSLEKLPKEIQKIMENRCIDADAVTSRTIHVSHAY